MPGLARGNIEINIEECKDAASVSSLVHRSTWNCRWPERLWRTSGAVCRRGLLGMRYLLLLLLRSRERSRLSAWQRRQFRSRDRKEGNMRRLCKGNVAVIKGAILPGCSAFY